MAIHALRFFPDPVLLKVAKPVDIFDDELRRLIDDMFETMYDARGCGLAAPQIGISKQLAVIDTTADKSMRCVLINPKIIASSDLMLMEEGCLSVPGIQETVERANRVTLRALDEYGKEYELEAEGLLAEAIAHEIDHLNGKLFIDKLSHLKRNRAIKSFEKYKREQGIS